MIGRNITNENQDNKKLDCNSYIIIKNHNFVSSVKDEDNKFILGSKNCLREESNNIYESNFNNIDIHNNINVVTPSHLNEEIKSHQIIETIPTEELFIKQKEKIKLYKERNNKNKNKKEKLNNNNNININNANSNKTINLINTINTNNNMGEEGKIYLHQKKIFNGTFKILTLENFQFFEKAFFKNLRGINSEENIPILKNIEWKSLNKPMSNVEFKKMALRTINEVNYETNMIDINVKFTLEAYSEFWIFTRCYINKEVNESINFDNSSINNEPDIIFNKYSSLIKIIKEKYSNKCFITFGTFCESSKNPNQVLYKTFLKRQLVDFNENDNFKYLENDICEFNVYITDAGNENIDTKIAVNCDDKFNYVLGNFYLPTNKRSKILFCGEGQSVIVKNLVINNFEKTEENMQQFDTHFSLEQKSCSCCNVI